MQTGSLRQEEVCGSIGKQDRSTVQSLSVSIQQMSLSLSSCLSHPLQFSDLSHTVLHHRCLPWPPNHTHKPGTATDLEFQLQLVVWLASDWVAVGVTEVPALQQNQDLVSEDEAVQDEGDSPIPDAWAGISGMGTRAPSSRSPVPSSPTRRHSKRRRDHGQGTSRTGLGRPGSREIRPCQKPGLASAGWGHGPQAPGRLCPPHLHADTANGEELTDRVDHRQGTSWTGYISDRVHAKVRKGGTESQQGRIEVGLVTGSYYARPLTRRHTAVEGACGWWRAGLGAY